MSNVASKLVYGAVVLALPFFLGFGMIRAVLAWDYPSFEYQRIVPDRYGFTPEERLSLAHATLDYMQRSEPAEEVIYLLEDLRLPDSDQTLYNAREISHMLDVKHVTDAILTLFFVATAVVVLGVLFLFAQADAATALRAVYHGGIATVVLLAVIAVLILVGWSFFFVAFHELLFPPDTWTFSYSDSLIRLFPEQFWFDVGVIISVGTLLAGVVVAAVGYSLSRRTARVSMRR